MIRLLYCRDAPSASDVVCFELQIPRDDKKIDKNLQV